MYQFGGRQTGSRTPAKAEASLKSRTAAQIRCTLEMNYHPGRRQTGAATFSDGSAETPGEGARRSAFDLSLLLVANGCFSTRTSSTSRSRAELAVCRT